MEKVTRGKNTVLIRYFIAEVLRYWGSWLGPIKLHEHSEVLWLKTCISLGAPVCCLGEMSGMPMVISSGSWESSDTSNASRLILHEHRVWTDTIVNKKMQSHKPKVNNGSIGKYWKASSSPLIALEQHSGKRVAKPWLKPFFIWSPRKESSYCTLCTYVTKNYPRISYIIIAKSSFFFTLPWEVCKSWLITAAKLFTKRKACRHTLCGVAKQATTPAVIQFRNVSKEFGTRAVGLVIPANWHG